MSETNEKVWLLLGVSLTIFAVIIRLVGLGWMAIFGIGSVLFFLPIQVYYLLLDKKIAKPTNNEKVLIISPIFLFPMIFLLQPDFGDSGGIIIMFELLIGNEKRIFLEDTTWVLAIIAAISYLIIIIYLTINLKKIRRMERII